MKEKLKQIIRKVMFGLGVDLTRNQRYDRLTVQIMRKVLQPNSNCIDVGCHRGEMLSLMLKFSPEGEHWAFEPIPSFLEGLQAKFHGRNLHILPYALSDMKGETSFQHVKNAPAYSGIRKRKYEVARPDIEEIRVQTDCLDNLIKAGIRITLIKIDVEGGEYGVMKGAQSLLKRDKPVVIFEFGLGAADCYGTDPAMMFSLLTGCGLRISTLKSFHLGGPALDLPAFERHFQTGSQYYFVAHP